MGVRSEDSIFCVTSILVSQIVYICINESLAADALDGVRSRGNLSTLQLSRKWRQNDGEKDFKTSTLMQQSIAILSVVLKFIFSETLE